MLVRLPSGPEADVMRGRIAELGEVIDIQEALRAIANSQQAPLPGGLAEPGLDAQY